MAATRNRELTRTRSSALPWRGAGAERMGAVRRGPWRVGAGRMRAARRSSTLQPCACFGSPRGRTPSYTTGLIPSRTVRLP